MALARTTYDGTGTLVVEVKVTRRVPQVVGSLDQLCSVGRKDGTGQGVFGGGVDELAGLFPSTLLGVVVDVDGDDGSKDLLGHGDRLGVLGEDDGGLDVESLRVVPSTSGDDLTTGLFALGDHAGNLLESRSSDDGSDKVLPLGRRSDGDLLDLLLQDALKLGPLGLGNVTPREGGTLLSLVLETGSDGLHDARLDVGRRVVQVEVLSTGLSDDPGVTLVDVEVLGNVLPELLEDVGGSGKVEAGKVPVVDALLDNLGRVTL
jgi:hypothetical protein